MELHVFMLVILDRRLVCKIIHAYNYVIREMSCYSDTQAAIFLFSPLNRQPSNPQTLCLTFKKIEGIPD